MPIIYTLFFLGKEQLFWSGHRSCQSSILFLWKTSAKCLGRNRKKIRFKKEALKFIDLNFMLNLFQPLIQTIQI